MARIHLDGESFREIFHRKLCEGVYCVEGGWGECIRGKGKRKREREGGERKEEREGGDGGSKLKIERKREREGGEEDREGKREKGEGN